MILDSTEMGAFRNAVHFVKYLVIVIMWLVFVKTVVKVDGKGTIALKVCLFYGVLHSYGGELDHVFVFAYHVSI